MSEWPHTESVVPHWAAKTRRAKRESWTQAERIHLAKLWNEGTSALVISELLGKKDEHSIYSKAHQMGLPRRKSGKTRRKRQHRADPTGQRRKTRLAATDGPKITLEPHDPRSRAGITVFPSSVIPAAKLPRLLKSGHNSFKIGKTVAKGPWRGSPIFTLTLEERATCPRTCEQWATCYGNNMPFAHRIFDDGTLTRRLWAELAALAAEHPSGFLIRLHVLGDFFSEAYVEFWRSALEEFAPLRIFGFTARIPPDPIGSAVAMMVRDFYDRCRIRFSGPRHETDCAIVIDAAEDAIGVLCPAERDPNRCCATCGLCWHSNRSISFLRH